MLKWLLGAFTPASLVMYTLIGLAVTYLWFDYQGLREQNATLNGNLKQYEEIVKQKDSEITGLKAQKNIDVAASSGQAKFEGTETAFSKNDLNSINKIWNTYTPKYQSCPATSQKTEPEIDYAQLEKDMAVIDAAFGRLQRLSVDSADIGKTSDAGRSEQPAAEVSRGDPAHPKTQ